MTEYGTVIDKRNLATAQSVSNLNGRVSNLSKATDDVKDIAESALKVATIEYAIGTETEATGEWQALTPKPGAGEYVWQRVTVTTGAGKTTQTTSLIQNIAATAQSTADTAKKDAATAQTGVDTLNTYIRRCDDGVEVARKDADGNYVGYKTIHTADGVEVRTADDVLVARYGSEIWLTNGIAEGFRVKFGNTLVPIKEIYPAKIEATGGETGTWAKTYTTRWAADQASGLKVSGHIYAAYASVGNLKEATMDFELADGESKSVNFSDGVQAAKASVSVVYLSSGYAAATISIEIGADNTVLSNVGVSYASPKSDVCMATLGTHPDTSTPAVFRIGNGTTGAPSNALVVDWNGNVTAKGNVTAGLVNNTQAGAVTITPNKNINIFSSTWYSGVATVAFDEPFDALPALNVTSQGGINIVYVSDISTTKFNITVCRPTKSAVNVHWMAMKRTQ